MSIRNTESLGSHAIRVGLTAALAVAAFTLSPAVQAADQGLRVFRDPVTGQLRAPTAAEVKALEAAAPKSAAKSGALGVNTRTLNPKPIRHANGAVEQELTDNDMSYSVATRNADGSANLYCVTGADTAAKVMKGQKTGVKLEEISKGHNHDRN